MSMHTIKRQAVSQRRGVAQVRLNMTQSDHAWHEEIVKRITKLNESGYNIAVMVDTEGSEAHLKAQDPVHVKVRGYKERQCSCVE